MSALSLRSLARALRGTAAGNQVLAPGPNHSAKDRSLSVRLSPSAPDGFIAFSHAGDDWRTCRDHVREQLGTGLRGTSRRREVLSSKRDLIAEPGPDRTARVLALWNAARDPRGTVVERYLGSRWLELPDEAAGSVLRFHLACPWRDEASGEVIRVPAMVAAMRCIRSDQLVAVHRTRLTEDGRKLDRRMLGTAGGAAIKLDADENVLGGLTIGEGIETCLAARQLGFAPVWALGSVGGIARFPVLPGIDVLTVLAETGDNGASERAVGECGRRWNEAGREVLIVVPNVDGDVNDATRRAA